jgi:hypothetical protein
MGGPDAHAHAHAQESARSARTQFWRKRLEHHDKNSPENPLPACVLPEPAWYFFYGTLMDPEVLARVAGLDKEPIMSRATIRRKRVRYWGPFRALCRGEDSVDGLVWYASSVEIVERLRAYESDAYRDTCVYAELENGKKIIAHTFFWNGEEEDLTVEPTEIR